MKSSKTVELTPQALEAIERLIEIAKYHAKSLTRYHQLELDAAIGEIRECVGDNRSVY